MRKKILLFVVTAVMLFVPIVVFAGDKADGKTEQQISREEPDAADAETTEVNNGTIVANNGTITTNNGTITTNNGTITTNNGTVINNNGTIITNNGTITNHNGSVTTNNGTISNSGQAAGQQAVSDSQTAAADRQDADKNAGTESKADSYNIVDGDKQTWSGSGNIRFWADGAYKKFNGVNYSSKDGMDLYELDEANFSAEKEDDTTAITLKESFLETLSPGVYVFSAVYDDGEAAAELTIEELDQSPEMGDSLLLWILACAMIVSGTGTVLILRKQA